MNLNVRIICYCTDYLDLDRLKPDFYPTKVFSESVKPQSQFRKEISEGGEAVVNVVYSSA